MTAFRETDLYDFDEDLYRTPEQELVEHIQRDFVEGIHEGSHRVPVFRSNSGRNMLGLATYDITDLATMCSAQLSLSVLSRVVSAHVGGFREGGSELLLDGIAHMPDGDTLREVIHPELAERELVGVIGYTAIVDGNTETSELFATTNDGQTHLLPTATTTEICGIAQKVGWVLRDEARAEFPIVRNY